MAKDVLRIRRRLVDALSPPPRRTDRPLRLRMGVITQMNANGTCHIKLSGDTTELTNVGRLANTTAQSPAVGDNVFFLTDGLDVLVLGRLAVAL